jgi:hypothetical protein
VAFPQRVGFGTKTRSVSLAPGRPAATNRRLSIQRTVVPAKIAPPRLLFRNGETFSRPCSARYPSRLPALPSVFSHHTSSMPEYTTTTIVSAVRRIICSILALLLLHCTFEAFCTPITTNSTKFQQHDTSRLLFTSEPSTTPLALSSAFSEATTIK